MNNGVLYARDTGLAPGTALTPEQVGKLPNDMVWLVNRDITLPDGSTTQALVPQVYAKVLPGGSAPATESVVTANRIDFNVVSGDFHNTRTLMARDAVSIRADNVHNVGGRIQAGHVALSAHTDITNVGGQIIGRDSLLASAGRDIDVSSTLVSQQSGNAFVQNASTAIDKVGSFAVTNTGGALLLEAGRDIHLTAAHLSNTGAGGQTSLSAKNDIHLKVLTTSQDDAFVLDPGNHGLRSRVEDVGSLVEATGDVWLKAGNDVNLRAARVTSTEGVVSAEAGRDLNLLAGRQTLLSEDARQTTAHRIFQNKTTVTYDKVDQVASIGTVFQGKDVQLKAGRDVTVQASTVNAAELLNIDAGRDLLVTSGESRRDETHDRHTYRSANGFGEFMGKAINASGGFDIGLAIMQKKAEDKEASQTQQLASGSVLTAGAIRSRSGRDTQLQGATVVADHDIDIRADGNLSLLPSSQAKTDTSESSSYTNGQIGSWYQPAMGSVKQDRGARGSSNTLSGTQVTSLHGNVNLEAGETFTQTASQVVAPEGDVDIAGKQVVIDAGHERGESESTSRYGKTALGGSISIPLVSALQSIKGMAESAEDTGDTRMKGLAAVNTALAAKDAYNAASALMDRNLGGIKISVNLSHDESKSADEQSGSNVVGSLVAAGGDVNIRATGAGQDSTLSVVGSRIDAGGDAHLKSDGAVVLKAAENTAHQQGTNSSSGVSIGVGFAFGGSQNGFTIDLAASMSRGKADGDDSLWTNTHVTAGKTFTLESKGDTTLQGAVVAADRITGNVGGNLTIASLQDSSTFKSEQMSAGLAISLCIPPICAGLSSVSGSYSQSKIDSNFLSVGEQSGFKAGDGGYQIKVGGNTDLTGGVIASSDKAIADGKNSFEHGGTVTQRDLQNRVEFKGNSMAVSGSVGTTTAKGDTGPASPTRKDDQPSAAFGIGSDKGFQASVTRSGIGVSTSEDTAGVIKPIFDAAKVQRELNAQVNITKTFSQAAPRAIADFAAAQMRPVDDAKGYTRIQDKQASGEALTADERSALAGHEKRGMTSEKASATLSDPKALENYNNWKEGGFYRMALHTAAGALAGGVDGALGAGTVATAAPALETIQERMGIALVDAGLSEPAARFVSQGVAQLTATGLGATVGHTSGAGLGLVVDTNNRMNHAQDRKAARRLAEESRGRYSLEDILAALRYSGVKDESGQVLVAEGSRETYAGDGPENLRNTGSAPGLSLGETWKLDPGLVLRPDLQYPTILIEDAPSQPDRALANYILANTGGQDSRYSFDSLPSSGRSDVLPPAPTGTYRTRVAVDGASYLPLMVDCPAVSCTNGDPIAFAIPDPGTQAYQEALARKIDKDLNAASLVFGLGGTLLRAGLFVDALLTTTTGARTVGVMGAEGATAAARPAELIGNLDGPSFTRYLNNVTNPEIRVSMLEQASIRRAELPFELQSKGNLAVARLEIPGLPSSMKAYSRFDSGEMGYVPMPSGFRVFEPLAVDKYGAVDTVGSFLRNVDGEFKILEATAQRLGNNPAAAGRIDLFTELKACTSCGGAIVQFRTRYPNIQLNVFTGKQ
jgi:filamentous hemagglutinin